MSAPITTLRTTIAAILDNPLVWSVFSFPPATPLANSVVLSPSDPYLVPSNNQYKSIYPMANLKISMFVPLLDNQGNLEGIENFMVAVFTKLSDSALVYNITGVSAPAALSLPSGDLLTCDFNISVLSSWE